MDLFLLTLTIMDGTPGLIARAAEILLTSRALIRVVTVVVVLYFVGKEKTADTCEKA